jgi:hypothetical protein
MKYRFMISVDGGVTYDIPADPSGVPENLVEWERDTSNGRASKRMVIGGPLTFSGTQFRYFENLDVDGAHCEPIYIQIQLRCRAAWRVLWTGRFPKGGGSWDLDKCTWVITPDPIDRFTCLEEGWEIKQNILQVGPVDAAALNLPSLEFGACITVGLSTVNCSEFYDGIGYVNEWLPGHAQIEDANGDSYQLNIFWRERITTECVAGVPVPPPGSGWVLLTDDCASSGTATYIRQTAAVWGFGDAVRGTIVLGVPTPPDSDCLYQYIGTIDESTVDPFDLTLGPVPFFICLSAATGTELNRARPFDDIMAYLVDKLDCDIVGVRSDFFEINAPGDAPGFVAGENYVTGATNQVSALMFLQKSDAVDPGAAEPAVIGEISMKELLRVIGTMFQVLWDIDADGYLRLEHYSYFYTQPGIDTASYDTVERRAFASLNGEIPRVERASASEAQGRDFVGLDIKYSGPCVSSGSQKEIEYGIGEVMTDINMILSDPTSVSRKGFVILATAYDGSVYNAILDTGAITGNFTTNAPLSWANLQRDYWTWNRYLPSANMNGVDTVFDGFRANVQQQPMTVKCFDCEALAFDGDQTVATRLGEHFGDIRGQVEKASLDRSGNLKLTLRYSR